MEAWLLLSFIFLFSFTISFTVWLSEHLKLDWIWMKVSIDSYRLSSRNGIRRFLTSHEVIIFEKPADTLGFADWEVYCDFRLYSAYLCSLSMVGWCFLLMPDCSECQEQSASYVRVFCHHLAVEPAASNCFDSLADFVIGYLQGFLASIYWSVTLAGQSYYLQRGLREFLLPRVILL